MFKYSDNDMENFSLHDCRATSLTFGDSTLTFGFEEGFWYAKGTTMLFRDTGKGEVEFHTVYPDMHCNIYVDIFEWRTENEDDCVALRRNLPFEEFVKLMNSGMKIEFLKEYKGYQSYLYECDLFGCGKYGDIEATITISADSITYRWNDKE